MTDFKVTDEAIEAGVAAAENISDDRMPRHKVVRAILEAALPVMFEEVGVLVNGCHYFYVAPSSIKDGDRLETVYGLKEPK